MKIEKNNICLTNMYQDFELRPGLKELYLCKYAIKAYIKLHIVIELDKCFTPRYNTGLY